MNNPIVMAEGIEGYFYFHLAQPEKGKSATKALCGAQVMSTEAGLDTWGFVGHLREWYCSQCKELSVNKEGK